ncbi:DUF2231 domain-containing protein [Allopontixanthobacter sp.]|uniref:DUF2231 domain-containing protein n=1 Tax=Allopontixanthobacter sp. TaxID=2906452 RepID=UPI002AB830D1|nr:DUF2231 domain-containing protein [Allopontixanthobacter sp.]MDZ4306934.1 DUF2231 domain-containing protein [Allopontixanthobacter sp.]
MDSPTRPVRPFINPLHGIFLAFPVALYPAALLSDVTYLNTAVIQWANFSSWLLVGANFFAALVLVWAVISLFAGRARHARGRGILYLVIIAIMFAVGFLNSLQHARDGWHSVGTFGLAMSIVCSLLALVAAFIAYGSTYHGETR